ncbi:MAG: hypothetical protein WC234_04625 [Endomicrobiaceae bacterium]
MKIFAVSQYYLSKFKEKLTHAYINIDLYYAVISFLHFFLTFFTDSFVFTIHYRQISVLKYAAVKLMLMAVLFVIWQLIGHAVRIYRKSLFVREYAKFTFIYFDIMLLFLLAVIPGNIKEHADFYYLANTAALKDTIMFEPFVMEYFRIFSMMLFPCLSGIVLGQLVVISSIVGYIMTRFSMCFKSSKLVYFLYIPFLLFLVIQNNLFMDTCIMYSYLILLLVLLLFFMKARNEKITKKNMTVIALITALLGNLRAEGILFLVFVPVIFVIINYHKIKEKQIVFFLLVLFFSAVVLMPKYINVSFISAQEGKYEGAYKKLYIIDYSFKVLLKEAVRRNDREILSEFDSYEDVNYMLADSTKIGMPFYVNLPEKKRKKFDIIAAKLSDKYKKTYLIYKIKDSLLESYNHAIYKIGIEKINFSDNKGAKKAYNRIDERLMLYCNDMRNYFVDFFKKHSTSKGSLIFPLGIIFSILLISALFMRKTLFLLSALILIHSFSVSLLAPYGAFRYNFSLYMYGYLIFAVFIISTIYNLKAAKKLKFFI